MGERRSELIVRRRLRELHRYGERRSELMVRKRLRELDRGRGGVS